MAKNKTDDKQTTKIKIVNDFSEQARTLDDAKHMLKKYRKSVIIRPTGFGKTWLLTELIKDYDKVLYLYPSGVIRDTVVNRYYDSMLDENNNYVDDNDNIIDPETIKTYMELKQIENCTLMTYAKLIRFSNEELAEFDYDLIIFDECHRLGGKKTKNATEKLFAKKNKKTHYIGATATPTRMDNFDVCSHFFSDHITYIYTLYDAIENGLIQKPNYCYATYDFRKDIEDAFKKNGENIHDAKIEKIIDAKTIELSKIYNMPKIIRDTCDEYAHDTEYMKFIIFFANIDHLNDKIKDVISWFHTAYKNHKIEVLKISSRSKTEAENIKHLQNLKPKKNTIHLIACVDMLNVGNHLNNQTGILMYRGTKSNTVFTQQLGRALSVGVNNSAIIFDIVDNLHRKAAYELFVKDTNNRNEYAKSSKNQAKGDNYSIAEDGKTIITKDDNGEIIVTQYHIDNNGDIVDIDGNPSTFVIDEETKCIVNTSNPQSDVKTGNIITNAHLHATGNEATYREIIAKTTAEPMSHRCKYALQLHFKTWCHNHGVPYPISDKELSEVYELDIQDFYNEFCNRIRKNNIDYPLQDAEKLLKIGENDPLDAPLRICAEAAGTSIEQVLDMLFGTSDIKSIKQNKKEK